MAHFHKKIRKGRPYLYVREIARVNGKPKVVNQVYIGSPEKVRDMARGKTAATNTMRYCVQSFGALWCANQIDQLFDLKNIIDNIVPGNSKGKGPSVGGYFLYAVLNRMVEVKSTDGTYCARKRDSKRKERHKLIREQLEFFIKEDESQELSVVTKRR